MHISYIKKPIKLPSSGLKPLATLKQDKESKDYYFGSIAHAIMMSEEEIKESCQKGTFIELPETIKYKQNHTLCICPLGNLYYCDNKNIFKKSPSKSITNISAYYN